MATPQFGMFGPLPFEVQAMQDQQFQADAVARARLDPYQHGRVMSAMGGRDLGQGIAGVFGGEDPAVARSKQLQTIAKEIRDSGVDPSNFEDYYSKLGEALAQAGLMREAASVADALQSYRDKQFDLDTKRYTAETARMKWALAKDNKLNNEIVKAIFQDNSKYDPASLEAYNKSITPENPTGDLSTLKHADDKKNEWSIVGVDEANIPVWENKDGRLAKTGQDGNLVPYGGPVNKLAKGNNTSVTVGGSTVTVENQSPKPPNARNAENAQRVGARWQAQATKFDEQFAASVENKAKIQEMRKLVNSGNLITGAFSDFRKEATRWGNFFGLGSPESIARLNDSDLYDKFVMGTVLSLMKQLGGSDSNEELRTLRASAETREWNPEAIKRALKWTEDRIKWLEKVDDNYNAGLEAGRTDDINFDYNTGKWRTSKEIPIAGDEGKSKVKSETRGSDSVPPAVAAPAPSNFNNRNDAIVDKYMKEWGTSREETIRRIKAAKAARGK